MHTNISSGVATMNLLCKACNAGDSEAFVHEISCEV